MNQIELTDYADTVFRASAPTLESSKVFAKQCAQVIHSDNDQVVGCYTGSNIHLFKVSDERLAGMVEVTAAHELLHAVFQRLSPSERKTVGEELEAEYERLSTSDPELYERMQVYTDLDHDAFVNELHSVFGTEVTDLSPALEAHYAQYFKNRPAILELFTGYNSTFKELDAQRKELKSQLEVLGASIQERGDAYKAAVSQYNSDAQSFQARNERYEFSDNPTAFYAIRSELDARRASLEGDRLTLNADIDRYNSLREQLLTLDATAQELIRSLDSTFTPPES